MAECEHVTATYIVVLLLKPVKRLLRTIGTVTRGSLHFAIGLISATATWDLRLGKSNIRRATCDIAPKAIHVV